MGRRRSGKHILGDIDKQAHKMRETISDLNQNIGKTQKHIEQLRQDEAEAYLMLAEVRMDLLNDPEMSAKISLAEKDARESLKARQKSRTTLDKSLKENQQQQDTLEQQRIDLASESEKLYVKVKEAEIKIEQALPDDPAYQKLLERIMELEDQIHRVDNKIVLAREDYQEKSKPYHADELFIYLKTKNYGTSSYSALPLIGVLDDWVAKIADYERARRDYAMLLSIPGKLTNHKNLLAQKIETLEGEIQDYKKQQFKKHGAFEVKQNYLEKQGEMDEIDTKLETLEQEHIEILQSKSGFGQQADEFYNESITTLKNIYQSKTLHNLRRYVAMTEARSDDDIVQKLFKIEEEMNDKEAMLSAYTKSLSSETHRLSELQKVRKTYKKNRYDVRRTTFEDGNMFNVLLSEFLMGVLSNRHFWRGVGHIISEVLDEIEFD